MSTFGADHIREETLLLARILIALLFVIFGWEKLTGFSESVQYMAHVGAPLPTVSAIIAIAMEFFVGIAIILGAYTRPLALLLALYTLGTALIAHHYWTMTGMEHFQNEIHFYKNISIIGGLLTLYVTGAGRYSIDAVLDARRQSR
jgi:putative oxidoreductase